MKLLVFLNKHKAVPLSDVVCILKEKHKTKKRKSLIITSQGKKIHEKNNIEVLINRIEKQKGFLK